jgi:hypothetical protein
MKKNTKTILVSLAVLTVGFAAGCMAYKRFYKKPEPDTSQDLATNGKILKEIRDAEGVIDMKPIIIEKRIEDLIGTPPVYTV